MSARYAIYYAPQQDDPLAHAANHWLGRDAWTGAALPRPAIAGLNDLDLETLTKSPRHYGFHATLKAPFELADGQTESRLVDALHAFCAAYSPFEAEIALRALSAFVAFRLTGDTVQMAQLHEACVRSFEPFRAPLSPGDLARRRKAALTPLQDERLIAFGYPYIFEDFRFHMTLSGAIHDEAMRERVVSALQTHFAPFSGVHQFWGLSLFKQADRDAPFNIIETSAFRAIR